MKFRPIWNRIRPWLPLLNPLDWIFLSWSSPDTRSAGDVLSATNYNTYLRDNLIYLHSGRPKFSIFHDKGSDYTTTSTTFVDVDGTNLKGTLTLSGSAVLIGFTCQCHGNGNVGASFDITVDGVRLGNAGLDGLLRSGSGAAGQEPNVALVALITDLSVGSHTFKVQWKLAEASGTALMRAGNGTSLEDYIPHFWGVEIA